MEEDALDIVEEAFRFKALVDCMEAFGFELKETMSERDYLFSFDNELVKNYSPITVRTEEGHKGWVYENGEARECVEETRLEGYGAYYLLNITTTELTQDSTIETPSFTQAYIEMK